MGFTDQTWAPDQPAGAMSAAPWAGGWCHSAQQPGVPPGMAMPATPLMPQTLGAAASGGRQAGSKRGAKKKPVRTLTLTRCIPSEDDPRRYVRDPVEEEQGETKINVSIEIV